MSRKRKTDGRMWQRRCQCRRRRRSNSSILSHRFSSSSFHFTAAVIDSTLYRRCKIREILRFIHCYSEEKTKKRWRRAIRGNEKVVTVTRRTSKNTPSRASRCPQKTLQIPCSAVLSYSVYAPQNVTQPSISTVDAVTTAMYMHGWASHRPLASLSEQPAADYADNLLLTEPQYWLSALRVRWSHSSYRCILTPRGVDQQRHGGSAAASYADPGIIAPLNLLVSLIFQAAHAELRKSLRISTKKVILLLCGPKHWRRVTCIPKTISVHSAVLTANTLWQMGRKIESSWRASNRALSRRRKPPRST